MWPVPQTNLGHKTGNCFAACVASILHLALEDVPNFCVFAGDWWIEMQKWLAEKGLTALEVKLAEQSLSTVTVGLPVIFTGKSPRGTHLHSVVGKAMEKGFVYAYDPHPEKTFLDGEPTHLLVFVALRPDLVVSSNRS